MARARTGRLKKVPCVLCQAETLDVDSVCFECRDLHALGKTVLQKQKEDKDQAVIRMPSYRLEISYSDGREDKKSREDREVSPGELAAALGLLVPPEGVRSWESNAITSVGESVNVGFSQRKKGEYERSGSRVYIGTKSQAEAIGLIIEKFQNAMTNAFHEGFDRGRNLLSCLSDGSIKLDDYDEALRKRGRTWEV